MKREILSLFGAGVITGAGCATAAVVTTAAATATAAAAAALPATAEKPNIIIILTDDQGYQDLGCYGSPLIKTPHIDRMAAEGIRLTSFYAAAPVCSPSRAGLLTGRHPERTGVTGVFFPNSNNGLPPGEITMAQVLKAGGYATACIGKWHLGHLPQYLPTRRGFDYYYGLPYSNDMWLDGENIPASENILLREGKTLNDYRDAARDKRERSRHQIPLMRGGECVEWPADQDTLTKRYAEETVAFIHNNKEKPFFIYLTPAMPHVPLHASDAFRGKSARGLYGDCIEEIDWAVGKILRALKEAGLDQKTLVIFSSDNGPWTTQGDAGGSALPLRGGKHSSYEGGVRVPGIFRWPGKIPAGRTSDLILSALDILPTAMKLAGARFRDNRVLDGHDIMPVLQGAPGATSPWGAIGFEATAVRSGQWKYRNGPLHIRYTQNENPKVTQLFDLDNDIGEQNNLAETHPAKTREFQKLLEEYNKGTRKNNIQTPKPETAKPAPAPAATQQGATPNLALNKRATGSTKESDDLAAANAVDGDKTTRWSSIYNDNQWFEVDLGAVHTISRINIGWLRAYAKSYEVRVATNGKDWKPVYKTDDHKGGPATIELPAGTQARQVRLVMKKRGSIWGYSINELEIH
ncbi:MAG: sulfatase-like hydrolase/transferase [Opitutaceae bacterium]|jgi:arylsulfatase A|nr:sulfatase-like hydrolase/transferase [Opitutaceae bacterium]